MLNFNYESPTNFVFGKGTEEGVGDLTKAYGSKVLLHYGGGSIKKFGLYDRVVKSLKAAGIEIVELGGVKPNPSISLVREGAKLCKAEGVDFVLAVGGGSVIDSAKAIAAGAKYDGDPWDFFVGTAVEDNLPVGVVLTIPAAGSEVSAHSVVTNEEGNWKKGMGAEGLKPRFSIMNPELTMTLPAYQTACGLSDMFAHCMERYFTNEKQVELTDRLGEATMKTIAKLGPELYKNPNNYDLRAEVMWAGTMAHNGLLGVGRSECWGSHQIEHEISGIYDVAHGAGLSIVFPALMRYHLDHDVNRYARFASRVFDIEYDIDNPRKTALEGVEALERFYKQLDLPIRLSEIDVDDSRIMEMANKATGDDTYTTGNFVPMAAKDIAAILTLAL